MVELLKPFTSINKGMVVGGFLLFILGGNTVPVAAQQSESNDRKASITVSVGAEIVSSIEMVTIRNINLGSIQPSRQVLNIHPIYDPESGKMQILGQANSSIRISYEEVKTLRRVEGSETINFKYRLAGNSQDNQSTASLIDFNNFEAQMNGDGEYYIWIGGDVNIANLTPGNYQGDFTVEVEHM